MFQLQDLKKISLYTLGIIFHFWQYTYHYNLRQEKMMGAPTIYLSVKQEHTLVDWATPRSKQKKKIHNFFNTIKNFCDPNLRE